MTKPQPGAKMGRPAKYEKPEKRTYRVSTEHIYRVTALRKLLKMPSNSDVVEEAVIELYKHRRR